MRILLLLTIFLLTTQVVNAQDHGRGLEFDINLYESIPMKAQQTRGLYTSLPSKASLKQYCPLPEDQQHYSTCVGWAVGYAARTILWAKQNNINNRSTITSNAFSPAFIYRSISRDNTCKSGTHTSKAMQILKTKGNVLQKDFSGACPSSIPYGLYAKASSFKIQSYAKLFEYNASAKNKIESVKKSGMFQNPSK